MWRTPTKIPKIFKKPEIFNNLKSDFQIDDRKRNNLIRKTNEMEESTRTPPRLIKMDSTDRNVLTQISE